MPYIKQEDRAEQVLKGYDITKEDLGFVLGEIARNAGDFNYVISHAIAVYLQKHGLNYANCNEMVGMLECCKQEVVRRVVSPYEDQKIEENGDCGYSDLFDTGVIGRVTKY